MSTPTRTVWVLGDQLDERLAALTEADPGTHRVLMVVSETKLASKRWHVQRAHLVLTAMHRFADRLRSVGWDVDLRDAPSLPAGLAAHRAEFGPVAVSATEPASIDGRAMLLAHGVELVRTNQFLCHPDEFAEWAGDRKMLRMEDFYRWQRRRLGVLMDGDEPAGGRWNFDEENRQPPPKDGRNHWPVPERFDLDDLDAKVVERLRPMTWGDAPTGWWPTSREQALARLDHFVTHSLPVFGPHEDAMTTGSWHLAHSLLAAPLNLGLLSPLEVVSAAEAAYRDGRAPIESVEGFVRQIIGWREYVHGVYWLWGPEYRSQNMLGAHHPLPPAFTGDAPTSMRCVSTTLADVRAQGWAHHIQRLMVLGNLALIAGIDPWAMTNWMWAGFVDGAEWVMTPNVIGMALHADGGRMASKPYAAGGAYIDRMSDYCKGCAYDRTARVGENACPFTTLYWDFLDRHSERFLRNARVARQVRAGERLADMDAVRVRAREVLARLDAGTL
ncbi:MAG: hypothetical protein RJB65_2228 [Actinomycetota bacterium]